MEAHTNVDVIVDLDELKQVRMCVSILASLNESRAVRA